MGSAQAVHLCEQAFEKACRPGVIGIGKSGTGHVFQAPVVQASACRRKATQAVTHGAPCGQLDESHHCELLLEAEFARRAPCFVSVLQFLKTCLGMNDSVWEKSVVWWLKFKISLCGRMLCKISLSHFIETLNFFPTP